jgi:uncharacterized protein involved in outer membrane biogenesis
VQTTLLGLAIAIILAIVAAIVAPLVVDWNHYRAPIEAEAGRLTGLNVRVNGAIEARILPSPEITLRDVEVGENGRPAQVRASMLKLELALGPLLGGQVQATQVRLIGPQLSVGLDRSGAIELPEPSPSFRASALSISRLSVEDGSILFTDAASGARLAVRKLWFNGSIASLAGTFSGEGAGVVGDHLYGCRISGEPATGGGTKIRIGVDPADRPLTTSFDGMLTFEHGVPRFSGVMVLARPVGATLASGRRVVSEPWRATGAIHATPAGASLQNLAVRYGPEERAINFTGSVELTFGAHPNLAAKVSAMQADIDRALANPDVTGQPPLIMLRTFLPTFLAAARLPMPVRIGLSIDSLMVGGTDIEALSGNLNFDQSGWSLDKFQFHAPGMTEVELSGRLTGSAGKFAFSGPAALSSADVETLLAWLDGHGRDRDAADVRTLSARGDVTIANDRLAVGGLKAAFDNESIEGTLAYQWPLDRPARLDAELRAAELDLDSISRFAKSAFGSGGLAPPREVTLALDVGKATFAGVDAQAVDAQVKFDAGKLHIDRLSVGNLAGAKIDLSGRIDELSSRPRGQMVLDLDASALGGVSDVLAKVAPQLAAPLRRAADRLAPAKVHAVLTVEQAVASGSIAELDVSGSLAAMRLAFDGKASGEPAHLGSAALQINGRIDADDGSALMTLLGAERIAGVDQLPGRLTLSATGPLDGNLHVDGKLETSGFDAAASGVMRLHSDGGPSGQLQVQAAAADLRPLHQAMTGQPGVAVPVAGHAALALDGAKIALTDIAAKVGNDAVHGHIAVTLENPAAVDGAITADRIDAARVLGILLGIPSNGPTSPLWAGAPISSGAFAAIKGSMKFKFDRADFTPALIARQLAGVAHFRPSAISLDSVTGELAGGGVAGALMFQRNADGLGAHVKIDLADVDATTLVGPMLNVAGGRLSLTLSSDGFGASPASLVASLRGIGAVTLKDTRFAGLDAAAFDAARRAAGQGGAIDLAKVRAAVSTALASGRLAVPDGLAAFTIASGVVDLNHVTLQAEGAAQLSLSGAIDLADAAIDARMTLSETPPKSALIATRPELSIDIKGPLAAPQRTLDMSALVSWLTLSAAELQTRRIESIEAARHGGTAAQSSHPDSPDVRVVSPGTVVETVMPPDIPSALPRAIERLQPPPAAPAAPQPGGAGATQKGAAQGAAPPIVLRPGALTARRGAADAAAGAADQNRRPPPQSAGATSPGAE